MHPVSATVATLPEESGEWGQLVGGNELVTEEISIKRGKKGKAKGKGLFWRVGVEGRVGSLVILMRA